ncbi:hypothetical protein V5J35_000505 [Endozoicomonas sp. NE40]|uniref:Uncharacterized protein n=1 Tax=Endozoicomonas lisbonensis TaxID=3120522 RepID=A0ABV2SC24_9GAMM
MKGKSAEVGMNVISTRWWCIEEVYHCHGFELWRATGNLCEPTL